MPDNTSSILQVFNLFPYTQYIGVRLVYARYVTPGIQPSPVENISVSRQTFAPEQGSYTLGERDKSAFADEIRPLRAIIWRPDCAFPVHMPEFHRCGSKWSVVGGHGSGPFRRV